MLVPPSRAGTLTMSKKPAPDPNDVPFGEATYSAEVSIDKDSPFLQHFRVVDRGEPVVRKVETPSKPPYWDVEIPVTIERLP